MKSQLAVIALLISIGIYYFKNDSENKKMVADAEELSPQKTLMNL